MQTILFTRDDQQVEIMVVRMFDATISKSEDHPSIFSFLAPLSEAENLPKAGQSFLYKEGTIEKTITPSTVTCSEAERYGSVLFGKKFNEEAGIVLPYVSAAVLVVCEL